MSVTTPLGRRTGRLAAVLATALALTSVAIAGPAQSAAPAGSLVQLFTESPDFTANPANAIQQGWWGHEGGTGPAGAGPTYLSLEGVDGSGQITQASQDALLAALGTDNFDDIGYAVVPYTADGSNERPTVTAGENAAEAFDWVISGAAGWGASLSGGSAANDSVTTVSDLAQLSAWVTAGRPLQGFDDSLVLHDLGGANPVSTAPKGKSILNNWPAGTQLSLVAYVTNGLDADLQNEVPLVEADGTGHAKTAWMPFTTVASPTSGIRTSAGYQVLGAYAPTVTVTSSFSGSNATLTATVKNNANGTATDATGSMMFAEVVGGVAGTAVPASLTNGVATLPVTGFAPGTARTYEVHYEPDAPAQATYLASVNVRKTFTNPQIATSTTLSAKGGSTDTFTATVTPGLAGKVTFKDGATVFATLAVSPTVRTVKAVRKLATGKHVVTATFTPTSTSYKTSVALKTVWQGTVSGVLKPARPRAGTRPKLIVRVTAPGAPVSGRVTVVFDPPRGVTKRFVLTLRAGTATILLPKVVKGVTRLTLMYGGNAYVLASNKVLTFRAT
ncbi:MAG: hypothetical protein J7518_10885 [Nocardioidaceae bacterium]|nr:hypothetical protein [Nocardioidaceae bacterium]